MCLSIPLSRLCKLIELFIHNISLSYPCQIDIIDIINVPLYVHQH